jgi:NAD(P)-dependent dehydrogenase (short-subunit alcohol dehydrogenase family)
MLENRPLAGQVAVVTGGGGGIGGGVSRLLARAGALVVLNDIDEALAETAREDIEKDGGRAITVVGDIREPETVARLRDAALAADGGRVDVLVNNVGDYRPSTTFARSTEEEWAALHAINFEHVLRVTHALLPAMVGRGSGSIVNVSTVESLRGIPGCPVYSAYNAAVIAFSRSLAVDVAGKGVRVNVIAPDMADTLQTPAASMLRGRDPELVGSWVPLGRFGVPEDYAKVVLFLASDMSSFVTGHVIPVDGGTTAASGWYRKATGKGWTNLPDQA